MAATPIAFSYIRFSTVEQKKGDSLRRQIAARAAWCKRNQVALDTSVTLHDLGRSAYTGEHRKNPDRHALATFLKLVEEGRVPRGSYLIIESLDRLTREHVRAGLMLILGLIEAGVRIVQLSPSEQVYDEKADEMALMMAIMELSRGHGESKRKSDLIGPAWRKKKAAAGDGRILTRQLPAWVAVEGGRLVLVPERAGAVKLIFHLAANGYGMQRIVTKLTADQVPPLAGKPWEKGYVSKILRDRRALGEYQPRGKGRLPDGDPVPGYFPAAVSEEEYLAARAGAAERKGLRGRIGGRTKKNGEVEVGQVNVFAKLVRDARDGSAYFMTARVDRGNRYYVISNLDSAQGRARCHSFPYLVFERAMCLKLAEVKPHEVMGRADGPDEVTVLSGELERVESSIALIDAEMTEHGESQTLFRRLRDKEEVRRKLLGQLAEARQKAAHPLSESWGQAHTLLSALDGAPDKDDARLRLRSVLRRVVEEIRLLVVARGRTRLAAVQVYFKGDGHRDYLIYHRPPQHTWGGRKEGHWWVRSEITGPVPGELDLRRPEHARELAAFLETADVGEAGDV